MANRPPQEVLDRIAAADVSETGIPIVDGKYVQMVKKIFFGDKRKGTIFIADFEVVSAEQTNKDVTPNAVGTSCGYAVAFYGNGADMADGNVKAFIIGAFLGEEVAKKGTPLFKAQSDRVGAILGSIIGDDQPARGMLLGCTTHTKPQAKDKTKDFTHHNWTKIESTEAEIKARRAKIDAEMAAPASAGTTVPPAAPGVPPAAPKAPTAFVPTPPWRVHPNEPVGTTPETRWYWDGAAGVKNEAQLKAGL